MYVLILRWRFWTVVRGIALVVLERAERHLGYNRKSVDINTPEPSIPTDKRDIN